MGRSNNLIVDSQRADDAADALHALASLVQREIDDALREPDDDVLLRLRGQINDVLVPLTNDLQRLARHPQAAAAVVRNDAQLAQLEGRIDRLVSLTEQAEHRSDSLVHEAASEAASAMQDALAQPGALIQPETIGDIERKVEKLSRAAQIKAKLKTANSAAKVGLKRVFGAYRWGVFAGVVPNPMELVRRLTHHIQKHGWDEEARRLAEQLGEILKELGEHIEPFL
jgi:hypothetical protein